MTRLKLLGVCALLAVGMGGIGCRGQGAESGELFGWSDRTWLYSGLTVTGDCTITGDVTINGNVTVAKGATSRDRSWAPG